MNTIKVSGTHMAEDAAAIQNSLETAKKHIAEMKEAVERLSGCWTGPAAEVYKSQVYADIEYMSEVCKEMENFINSFSEAKKDYAKAESDVYRSVSRMWFW